MNNYFYFCLCLWALAAFSSVSLMGLVQALYLPAIIYFFYRLFQEKKSNFSKSSLMVLCFGVVGIISVLNNYSEIINPLKSALRTKHFLAGFLLIPGLIYFFKEKATLKNIKGISSVLIIVLSLAILSDGIGHLFTGYNLLKGKTVRVDGRMSGLFGQTMTFAYLIQFLCLSFIWVLIYREKMMKFFVPKLFWFGLGISHFGLLMARSRGALVGYFLGLAIILFFYSKKYFKYLTIALIVIISIVIPIVIKGTSDFNLLQKWNSESNMIRISQYQAAIKMVEERPILGFGYNSFDEHVGKIKRKYGIAYSDFESHAHNNLFEVVATTGLIGLAFFLLWHLFWLLEILKLKVEFKSYYLAIFTTFVISGLVQNTLTDSEVMFTLTMLYALSQIKEFNIKEN